jgi:sugar (pentulose or hexulose) kinase
VEFDPEAWWRELAAAGAEAVERSGLPRGEYLAVTCTAMRIPFVLLDAGKRPARGRPELWRRVRHVLQLHDWLCFRLSGALASEPSSASMAQLLDVSRRTWATELLESLELDPRLLPPLRDAGERLGGLERDAAAALGLAEGTPVHVGGGDTHVACLGAGAAADGDVAIVAGSTSPIHLTSSRPLLDTVHEPLVSAHLRAGSWAIETNAGVTGLMYAWLSGLCGLPYPALDALAAEAPVGAGGLVVTAANPRWGEDSWSRTPPIALLGLTPGHSPGELARATLESICHAPDAAWAFVKMTMEPKNNLNMALWSGFVPPDHRVGKLPAFVNYAPHRPSWPRSTTTRSTACRFRSTPASRSTRAR